MTRRVCSAPVATQYQHAVVHNGVLDPGLNFIAKPFTLDQLAAKLREVLDRP